MKQCLFVDDHARMGANISHCFHCNVKIGKTLIEKWDEAAALVPREKKQLVMDVLKEGKTVGEACRSAGIESTICFHIIGKQIGSSNYMNWEVAA